MTNAVEMDDVVLPADPSIGRAARRTVRGAFVGWGLSDDLADRTMMVVTELASNALLHATPPYVLRLCADGHEVRVAVCDCLALPPSVRQYEALAATGRGLRLVAAGSTSWGVRARPNGKEVWAVLPYTAGDHAPPVMEPVVPPPVSVTDSGSARVRFVGVPVAAYLAMQEWNDAIVRECELIASLGPGRSDLPPRLVELAAHLAGHFATNREGFREIVAQAQAKDEITVDFGSGWPEPTAPVVDAAITFLDLMEELDGFCRTNVLLTGPPDAVVIRLRRWFVEQTEAQLLEAAAPTPFKDSNDSEAR